MGQKFTFCNEFCCYLAHCEDQVFIHILQPLTSVCVLIKYLLFIHLIPLFSF